MTGRISIPELRKEAAASSGPYLSHDDLLALLDAVEAYDRTIRELWGSEITAIGLDNDRNEGDADAVRHGAIRQALGITLGDMLYPRRPNMPAALARFDFGDPA